jgi:hypothetical protein
MQSHCTGLALAVCSILLGTCILAIETSPVLAASFREAKTEMGRPREEEDREVFEKLVKYLGDAKWTEQVITIMEKKAKCPFRALSFDGVTHVVCDFSDCSRHAQCPRNCRQVFAYLNPGTRNITTQEPQGDCEKVYMGCVYEEKAGIESKEPSIVAN